MTVQPDDDYQPLPHDEDADGVSQDDGYADDDADGVSEA